MFIFIFVVLRNLLNLLPSKKSFDEPPVISINVTDPLVVIDSRNQTSHTENQPTLVYTCLGEQAFTKHQSYIWESLRQSRLIGGPSLSIVVIINRVSHANSVQNEMKRLNITTLVYEDLLAMDNASFVLNSEFHKAFFIQGVMAPGDNVDFNQLTSQRLFALYAYMNVELKSNIFHIENDNLLYFDLIDLMHRMHTCGIHLGITKASPSQAVFSFLYVRNAGILEHFLRYTVEVFRLGRKKAMDYLKTEWINDMTIAGRYLDLFAATLEKSRATGISQLPVKFDSINCCLCTTANNAETIIFDARAIGQYFGGDYWHPGVSFWTKSDFLDPRGELLTCQRTEKGLLIPYIRGKRIVNIHVHSKNLKRFLSTESDQPTGRGYNFTIIVD
jgi:hypothetical protein